MSNDCRITFHAREVLTDCERLLEAITSDMQPDLWRPRWVGLVALLRAVGHVLKNVDKKCQSASIQKVMHLEWDGLKKSKPEPLIFWGFIREERNNAVKAYKISSGVNFVVRPGTANLCLLTGEMTMSSPSGPTTFEAFMRSGPFQGQDPLQLCREAIQFWQVYLDGIDRKALEAANG